LFFVGVGNMGNPMAANLIKAGYKVSVFDVTPGKADNLLVLGATWVESLAEGAAAADVVLASLPGPSQVREVMMGEDGVLAAMKPGTCVIDTSTSAVVTSDPLLVSLSTPSIAAGGTTTVSQVVTIPSGSAAGSHYVWVIADVYNTAGQGVNTSNDKTVKRLRQKVISKLWALCNWRVTTPAMDHMPALATIKATACPWLSPANMLRTRCGWRACGHAP
jgi:phosphoglycerate dehydrogenase-like enzyme